MDSLLPLAATVAARLVARKQTLAVVESSAGGLVAAALLAQPGASAFFVGGVVCYTAMAREAFLGITPDGMGGLRSASEPYASLLAERAQSVCHADWGLAETGAAGPTGNRYGDAAGHSCLALAGPVQSVRTLETGSPSRADNMRQFALAALTMLEAALA